MHGERRSALQLENLRLLGWLDSEFHFMHGELRSALQRKSLQVLALRVAARTRFRAKGQSLKALHQCSYTNSAIMLDVR